MTQQTTTNEDTTMTLKSASDAGTKLGKKQDHCCKNVRRQLITEAGCEMSSETANAFELAREAAVTVRREERAELKEKLDAKLDAINAVFAKESRSHRGEAMHDYAARKRAENAGLNNKAPKEILDLV